VNFLFSIALSIARAIASVLTGKMDLTLQLCNAHFKKTQLLMTMDFLVLESLSTSRKYFYETVRTKRFEDVFNILSIFFKVWLEKRNIKIVKIRYMLFVEEYIYSKCR